MKIRPRAKGIARFLPSPSWGGRTASAFFVSISVVLFALSAASPSNLQGMRAGATDVLAPVLGMVNKPFQMAASYVNTVSGLAGLQQENAKLRAENDRLREWYQTAMQLQAENESLNRLMHVAVEPQHKFVTARIVADSGNSYLKTLLVMAGRENGVDKGQAVISGEGLIGRTVEAGNRAARVLLVTDINSRVPVIIQGQGEGQDIRAMMAGRNDDFPAILHLPADTKLQPGARVMTSGNGGIFPFGLPIGVVQPAPDGTLYVRLFADIEKLTHVRVIDRDEDPNLIEPAQ